MKLKVNRMTINQEYLGLTMGSFGKRVQIVAIWIFSFELENLNWVIWTKILNYCLGQIILFENIIWIVVWIYVKLVIWVIKRVVKMSEEFDFEGFEWAFFI